MVKTAANSATVRTFLAILGSRITQYDQKLEVKQPNMYRLGLLLEAKHKAEDLVRKYLDDSTPEALEALKAALKKHFQSDFPPAKAVVKMVDEFLQNGKMPRLATIVTRFNEGKQASSVGKLSDLLRDAVKPGESGDKAKMELAKALESKSVLDAIEIFLRSMKQANISVGEALVMMARY